MRCVHLTDKNSRAYNEAKKGAIHFNRAGTFSAVELLANKKKCVRIKKTLNNKNFNSNSINGGGSSSGKTNATIR